ncbi:N-acetylmuramoyl-L-alanine amidase [Clostridium saccharobutylicum]|uniref:N-acetylmuramoyl-L-alanine amidase LytC n=1 Tax=Clostridium saccharobutylicum TaxID=169679 RepID=A0A1S8NJ11_CLOSA|nr:N-acetylmuramoyl-L-alanine amidase LytC precursor [Clostridium saccharobutylicum]
MKTNKRLTVFLLTFAMFLLLIPVVKVQAATGVEKSISDVKIISETEVTAKQAGEWAKSRGATDTFVSIAELYWKYAKDCGDVNPGIAYVQAAKETGYGKFGGVLDETYKNPCGMKTSSGGGDYDVNAHQRFNSWDEGVQAHMDHLALYAGADGYPKDNTYDPRHFVTIKGKATTVNSLGGKWAPSLTYGEEVNKLYNDLLTYAQIVPKTEIKPNGSVSEIYTTIQDVNSSYGATTNAGVTTNSEVNTSQTNNDVTISSSIGWRLEGGNWYYYKSDGTKATGWIKPDGNWYYLYSDGVMAKGWLNSGGTWFYLKSSGAMQTGWLKESGKWYYLQGDGGMVTGLKIINGKKYFLDSSGAMKISWSKIGGTWYYFDTDGSMVTGWIKPDGRWYYLYSDGIMATGWVKLNTEWYYLQENGSMATGWIVDGGKYYYLNLISGVMAKGTVINGWEIGPDGTRAGKVNSGTGNGSKKLIVIDPGHNFGGDDGAYATHYGTTYSERDLNMQVAVKLKSKLEEKGYQVIMTRNEFDRETLGVSQSLANRVNIANNFGADLFISLHHNAADSSSANGVEVYYSSRSQDESFGGGFSDYKLSVSQTMAASISKAIANATGAVNRGSHDGNLYVCRNTKMPSVLVEFGFITNPSEAARCADFNNQQLSTTAIAETIAAGI